MKVEICKSVEIETEVIVDIVDIATALHESLSQCESQFDPDRQDKHRTRGLLLLVSSIHECLSAVKPEMIDQLRIDQRLMIYDALKPLVERFAMQKPEVIE